MASKKTFAIIIVFIVIAAAGVFIYIGLNKKSGEHPEGLAAPAKIVQPSMPSGASESNLIMPAPTGNLDDIVRALEQDAVSEQSLIDEGDANNSALMSEEAAIGDIIQSFSNDEL